jgi:hypothetical protein
MRPLGHIKRRLRLVDGLLPAFTFLLPGGTFLSLFTLATSLVVISSRRDILANDLPATVLCPDRLLLIEICRRAGL